MTNVDEIFQYYRTSASIFCATIIGLSLAAIGALHDWKIFNALGCIWITYIPFTMAIICGVLAQYFIFIGYFTYAQNKTKQSNENPNPNFTRADYLTHGTMALFVIGLISFANLLVISCISPK